MRIKSICHQVKTNMKSMYPALCLTSVLCLSFNAVSMENNPIYFSEFTHKPADAFELASNVWLRIRLHAENSLRLPITEEKMRSIFLIPKDVDFAPYQNLLDSYQIIHNTADDWNRKVYPAIIQHAHTTRNYADVRPLYLQPITQSLSDFLNSKSDSDRQQAIAFLSILKGSTEKNRREAHESMQHLNQFHTKINEQLEKLNLLEDAYMEHAETGQQELIEHLIESRELLEELCDDYHQHVLDAATRANYKNVPLFGFIPFPVVSSEDSEKAEQVKKHITELQQNIKNTANEIKYKKKIAISYKNTLLSLLKVSKHTEEAKSNVELIHADWKGLSTDLDNTIKLLQNSQSDGDTQQSNTQLQMYYDQFQLERTSKTWEKINSKASKFTKNALLNKSASFNKS